MSSPVRIVPQGRGVTTNPLCSGPALCLRPEHVARAARSGPWVVRPVARGVHRPDPQALAGQPKLAVQLARPGPVFSATFLPSTTTLQETLLSAVTVVESTVRLSR
jgi:hypothetical protein